MIDLFFVVAFVTSFIGLLAVGGLVAWLCDLE